MNSVIFIVNKTYLSNLLANQLCNNLLNMSKSFAIRITLTVVIRNYYFYIILYCILLLKFKKSNGKDDQNKLDFEQFY